MPFPFAQHPIFLHDPSTSAPSSSFTCRYGPALFDDHLFHQTGVRKVAVRPNAAFWDPNHMNQKYATKSNATNKFRNPP